MTEAGPPHPTASSPYRSVAGVGGSARCLSCSPLSGWSTRFRNADIQWATTRQYLTADTVLDGMGRTLLISVLAQALGVALGVVAAVMRSSGNPVTGAVGWLYVWFFRGTPVYLQLLLWYNLALIFPTLSLPGFGSSETTDVMTPFLAALLGLGHQRGRLHGGDRACGHRRASTRGRPRPPRRWACRAALLLRRVVLPQAMRVIVPPTGNEFINMLKTSALA